MTTVIYIEEVISIYSTDSVIYLIMYLRDRGMSSKLWDLMTPPRYPFSLALRFLMPDENGHLLIHLLDEEVSPSLIKFIVHSTVNDICLEGLSCSYTITSDRMFEWIKHSYDMLIAKVSIKHNLLTFNTKSAISAKILIDYMKCTFKCQSDSAVTLCIIYSYLTFELMRSGERNRLINNILARCEDIKSCEFIEHDIGITMLDLLGLKSVKGNKVVIKLFIYYLLTLIDSRNGISVDPYIHVKDIKNISDIDTILSNPIISLIEWNV